MQFGRRPKNVDPVRANSQKIEQKHVRGVNFLKKKKKVAVYPKFAIRPLT